jgi:hypothetical protein
MSWAALVERRRIRHIPDVDEGRRWTRIGGTLLVAAGLLGCGANDVSDRAAVGPNDDYLGGQTGSLIPGCGLAPLSAAGNGVPAGDALGVLYTRDCPGQEQMLALQGVSGVALELVPLDRRDVFLVRADQSLSGGDYQLDLGNGARGEVHVEPNTAELPMKLGELRLAAPTCADPLRFELPLDEAMRAYAPLAKFEISLDGQLPQLWINYGALQIEDRSDGTYGVLELPRCSARGCLSGAHSLELQAEIAGETQQPASTIVDFDLPCLDAGPDRSASACSLGARVSSGSASGWLSVALGLLLCRRRRRRLSR